MKRIISLLLALAMILGMMPMEEYIAYAADDKATIKKIIINKTYESLEDLGTFFITITGDNLDKAQVRILGSGGQIKDPTKDPVSGKYVAQYSYPATDIGEKLFIDEHTYSLGEEDMPKITGRGEATSNIIGAGEPITLTGEKIENLKDTDKGIEAYFLQSSSKNPIKSDEVIDDNKIVKNVGTALGSHSLIFKRSTTESGISVDIEHTYKSIIIVRGDLTVTGNVSLFPSQGPRDSVAKITADKIDSNVSVFFMKKGEEYKYTKKNMALNESVKHGLNNGKEEVSFKVPKEIDNGAHEIVLTNRVDPNRNIDEQISKYKIIGNIVKENNIDVLKKLEFNVVDGMSSVELKTIDPNFSSIQGGVTAKIEGRNIVRISTNLYEKESDPAIDMTSDNKKMVVKYSGGKYNNKEVETIERTITVQIGSFASITNNDFSGDVYDYLYVTIPENDDLDKPIKDVIVFITNEITFKDGNKVTITEGDTIENGFTYNPIDYKPEIKSVVPGTIPVDENGNLTRDIILTITGNNFLKYGYKSGESLKIKTPEVSIVNQGLSNSWFDNENIEIYTDKDVKLDEKEGEQFGSKIKIKLKKGHNVPASMINSVSNLRVQNPLAIESDGDKGSSATYEIRFVKVSSDNTPIITSVTPSVVTTDGVNGIVIRGSNFDQNVTVYLDGERRSEAKVNGIGTEIIFNAPKKTEGIYQIIVQNEKGGLATFDEFEYVETRTNPKILDFNPKSGTAYTLVHLKGQNLVLPDTVVRDISGAGIYRLVGTRVFLGEEDVNIYNKENGKITLKPFVTSDSILDYYESVILVKDEGGSPKDIYYKIYKNTRTGKLLLTDGDKDVYELNITSGNSGTAKKGSDERTVEIADGKLKLKDRNNNQTVIELNIKTLYETIKDGKEISGHRVKVLDNNELIFTVPKQEKEGYYDVTIQNPDTKRDSRIGNNGFYYYAHPQTKPTISKIDPDKGSTLGDYYIRIEGSDFKDYLGGGKTSVIIGGIKVEPKDIEVATDGNSIRVKVPKYPGDLSKETDTGRKTVPVIVVNPDGASVNREDGFTYIIPISNPKITAVILNKGTAAGGENVSIEGTDFRFFEPFNDSNNNGTWDDAEPYTDTNGNGRYDVGEPFEDIVKDGSGRTNGVWDDKEYFDDLNNNGKWDDLLDKSMYENLKIDYEKLVKPILPTIYFGNQVAEIIGFSEGTVIVKTPKGANGSVDVYLVNNDYGVSNKVKYTYEGSKPKITSITPKVGKKHGKDKVEILGSDFHESKINLIKSANETEEKNIQLVQFGDNKDTNISNRDIKIDAPENSGRVDYYKSTVKVGDLIVGYDATEDEHSLTFTLERTTEDGKKTYTFKYNKYNDNEVYLPINLLKDANGNSDSLSYELVRIKMEKLAGANNTSRLRVDRGFSPESTLLNTGHISLKTPSYYYIGKVPVTVINPDGGEAIGSFEYKNPDSKPEIINIKKDGQEGVTEELNGVQSKVLYVNTKGGDIIDIEGKDFRQPVKIYIGEVVEINKGIVYDPQDTPQSVKATFTMPKVDDKYAGDKEYRIVLENEDGASIGSDQISPPIYIKFFKSESNPQITSISPKTGPSTGGTKVTIKGKDFRTKMIGFPGTLKVYFDDGRNIEEVPNENIKIIDIETIEVIAPPNKTKLGTIQPVGATIRVENPDGSKADSKDKFIYTGPNIENIIKETGSSMGEEVVYIEGNLFKYYEPFIDANKNGQKDSNENNYTDLNENSKYDNLLGREMDTLSDKDKKILPKIYFGDKEAEILSFTEKVIEVKVPGGRDEVDIYLKNNDGEESNRVKYKYNLTTPQVATINPKESPIQGGIKVGILGTDFYKSEMRVYKDTNIPADKEYMPMIQFAEEDSGEGYKNISNKNITDTKDINTGIFSNNKTSVKIGNLTVNYSKENNDTDGKRLNIILDSDKKLYGESMKFKYDDEEIFLPLNLLKDSGGNNYKGNELVKIKKEKLPGSMNIYRLVVERGYAQDAVLEKPDQEKEKITIESIPGYYTEKKIKIKITNPDGTRVEIDFEYKKPPSNPKITDIVDPENNDVSKNNLSVEGNEKIKILGSDFMQGARVVFNPKLKKVESGENPTGTVITINGEKYILESGIDGTNVEFLNSGELTVITPQGQLDAKGVIVINPDGSATQIYDITYGIPEISGPQKVTAQLIYDQYIRINWQGVKDATQYEIYVIEDRKREYIGTTDLTSFIYKDIEPNTTYEFLVRAVGKYGSSKPLDESVSNSVKTGKRSGPENEDGDIGEKTIKEKVGNTANVIIGSDGFEGSQFIIDLTRGELAGSTEVVVSISKSIITSNSYRQISIIGKDYSIKFSPSVFRNSKIVESSSKDHAGVKFKVSPYVGQIELDNIDGKTVIASQYLLEAQTYVGQDSTPIDNLGSTMEMTLDFDTVKADMRKLQNINMTRYNGYSRNWEVTNGTKGYSSFTSNISRLGTYTITGSRR